MTSPAHLSDTLVWNAELQRQRPDLLELGRANWRKWQARLRSAPSAGTPDVVAVVDLNALDDLEYHVGFMRLLGAKRLKIWPFLTFRSASAVNIAEARARREGWHLHVRFITADERDLLLVNLPSDFPVMWFGSPSVRLPEPCKGCDARAERLPISDRLEDLPNAAIGLPSGWVPKHFKPLKPDEYAPVVVAEDDVRLSWNGLDETGEARIYFGDGGLLMRTNRVLERTLPSSPMRVPAALTGLKSLPIAPAAVAGASEVKESISYLTVPPAKVAPWMLSAYVNRGGGGNMVMRAFARGTGCRISYAEDEHDVLDDFPVVWGVLRDSDRLLSQAKRQHLYWYYVDHAYFDRGHGRSYRISRNRYEAGPVRACSADRLDALDIPIQPWREGGRHIVVCPPTDYFMAAHNCHDWLENTLDRLKAYTDRQVVVRNKPRPGETAVPLAEALSDAHALVTHSSNVAIEAACLGTPIFVSPTSAAAPVGRTDLLYIEEPLRPDRRAWLSHLAYSQFTIEEIASGKAWNLLLENEERPIV